MRVRWYGPPTGQQSVEHVVSYSTPVASGLIRYSTALKREAANILSMTEHRSGEERSEIGVVHRENPNPHGDETALDSIVYLAAPDEMQEENPRGAYAAVNSIEFGHYTRPRDHEGEGPRTKRDHRRNWVKGVSPLRKAAKKMSANPKLSIK